ALERTVKETSQNLGATQIDADDIVFFAGFRHKRMTNERCEKKIGSPLPRFSTIGSGLSLRASSFGIRYLPPLLSRQYGANLLPEFRVNPFGRASAIDNAKRINPLQRADGLFHTGL